MKDHVWEMLAGAVVAGAGFWLSATVLAGTSAALPVFGLATFIAGKVLPQTRVSRDRRSVAPVQP